MSDNMSDNIFDTAWQMMAQHVFVRGSAHNYLFSLVMEHKKIDLSHKEAPDAFWKQERPHRDIRKLEIVKNTYINNAEDTLCALQTAYHCSGSKGQHNITLYNFQTNAIIEVFTAKFSERMQGSGLHHKQVQITNPHEAHYLDPQSVDGQAHIQRVLAAKNAFKLAP